MPTSGHGSSRASRTRSRSRRSSSSHIPNYLGISVAWRRKPGRRDLPQGRGDAIRRRPAARRGSCHGARLPRARTAAAAAPAVRLRRRRRLRRGHDARERGFAEDLMARAQAVGSPVLVLTIDLAVVGARHRDTRNAVVGKPSSWAKARRALDLLSHPRWIANVPIGGRPLTFGNLEKAVPDASSPTAFRDWVDSQFDPSVTWKDIEWVRENWNGRLVVKGVLDPDDARRAAEVGVDGVVVSNHGGRQLDAVPSTARALPDVVDAVGDEVEVLADGGVRTGLDVVKMVAMGARAVLVGRPWAWAVAARGEAGVRHVLDVMKADIDTALGLTGQTAIAAVDRSALYNG